MILFDFHQYITTQSKVHMQNSACDNNLDAEIGRGGRRGCAMRDGAKKGSIT